MAKYDTVSEYVSYSTDEGETWSKFELPKDLGIEVHNIRTEPTNSKMLFYVEGYNPKTETYTLISLDFTNLDLLKTTCSRQDYIFSNNFCLLGQDTFFKIKKPKRNCSNSADFLRKITTTKVCACTVKDFECSFGFYRQKPDSDCNYYKKIEEDRCMGKIDDIKIREEENRKYVDSKFIIIIYILYFLLFLVLIKVFLEVIRKKYNEYRYQPLTNSPYEDNQIGVEVQEDQDHNQNEINEYELPHVQPKQEYQNQNRSKSSVNRNYTTLDDDENDKDEDIDDDKVGSPNVEAKQVKEDDDDDDDDDLEGHITL